MKAILMVFENFRLSIRPFIAMLFFVTSTITTVDAEELGNMNADALKQFIEKYLMENPEVIINALENFQHQQETLTAQHQSQALDTFIEQAKVSDEYPSFGPDDADVIMIEFFDYQCGYCKRAFPDMMEMIESDGNIRTIFIELPILGPASQFAAIVALSAEKQGKYMKFHTNMMELRGQLTHDKIFEVAEDIGMNLEQLKVDIQDESLEIMLNENLKLADILGISGTPAFIIGTEIFKGAIPRDQMEIAVRQYREANS